MFFHVRVWLCLAVLQVGLCLAQSSRLTTRQVCAAIDQQTSSDSDIITFRGIRFAIAIKHWIRTSSQTPECVFQPVSASDLSTAIRLIGANRTPFAVYSGGHTSNPGFSSTRGVHINLSKLDQVTLSPDGSIARIGFGNKWIDVYRKLEGSGRMVTGGRVPGPGVGGLTLGGGYSWKSNEHGLTIDTVKSFTLVLPNGTISVIDDNQPDLFFALRGGMNRFGIVTDAEFYTHDQPPTVFAGLRLYPASSIDAVLNATARFEEINTDPKANAILALLGGTATVQLFYDGPTKPASFAVFDGIKTLLIDNVGPKSFADFVASIPSDLRAATNSRGAWSTLQTSKTTLPFLRAFQREAAAFQAANRAISGLNFAVDVYIPGQPGKHAVANTAYPHQNSPFPVLLDAAWTFPQDDEFWNNRLRQAVATLREVARSEGILLEGAYPNYALSTASAQELYGPNAERLARVRDQVDPQRVMDLAGGFII